VAEHSADAAAVVCVDFGSTFTKAALVSLPSGELLARASHRTTIDTDLWDGFLACREELAGALPGVAGLPVLACSSAGGGLRIAVVGNEPLVTAEAGRRVALSSGGRVVAVIPGPLDEEGLSDLTDSRPDVVLLAGGTDGGNAEVLLASARRLSGWSGPVVVAGNAHARDEVTALLGVGATPYVVADNVVPKIGVLAPRSARAAIRKMFLEHVIGGKHLSSRSEFARAIRGATPDIVLTAVEELGKLAGDVAVIDIGGATTDVYSDIEIDPEEAGREVVAVVAEARTVEGDLGMRWSATATVDAGILAGIVGQDDPLVGSARRRHDDTAFLPASEEDWADDLALASIAASVALRRHAGRSRMVLGPDGRIVERTGRDLREVGLLVGSGGVLRHAGPRAHEVLAGPLGVNEEGWQLPERPRLVVDVDYRLAPAGLLARDHPDAAANLLRPLVERATRG
jgi:uncharacterized protein (TIGR01319 family)